MGWEGEGGLTHPSPLAGAWSSPLLSVCHLAPFLCLFVLLGPDMFQCQPFCSGKESDSSKNRARLNCKVILVQSYLNSKD